MLVTLFRIVTLVKEEHLAKVPSPMLVTLSGIVTLCKDEQPAKAQSPMLVTGFPPRIDGMINASKGRGDISVSVAESSSIS